MGDDLIVERVVLDGSYCVAWAVGGEHHAEVGICVFLMRHDW